MQVLSSSYKKIKLSNSDRQCLVDERDYDRLSSFNWFLCGNHTKFYAACLREGKNISMHREIFGYHFTGFFNQISHRNNNKLDNRYHNLVAMYSHSSRNTDFHASDDLQAKLKSIAPNLAIADNGLVLQHSVIGVIKIYRQQVDLLLCQRLKAAQLLIESRNELLSRKTQLTEALSAIDAAIAVMDGVIGSFQPNK